MSLDKNKPYVDSRFRTSNSNSESDFCIETPRQFSVPDGVVAHVDDIVIPACWTTIDERNPNCYFIVYAGVDSKEFSFTMATANYDGVEFATVLAAKLNEAVAAFNHKPLLSATYER